MVEAGAEDEGGFPRAIECEVGEAESQEHLAVEVGCFREAREGVSGGSEAAFEVGFVGLAGGAAGNDLAEGFSEFGDAAALGHEHVFTGPGVLKKQKGFLGAMGGEETSAQDQRGGVERGEVVHHRAGGPEGEEGLAGGVEIAALLVELGGEQLLGDDRFGTGERALRGEKALLDGGGFVGTTGGAQGDDFGTEGFGAELGVVLQRAKKGERLVGLAGLRVNAGEQDQGGL